MSLEATLDPKVTHNKNKSVPSKVLTKPKEADVPATPRDHKGRRDPKDPKGPQEPQGTQGSQGPQHASPDTRALSHTGAEWAGGVTR